eukprot:3321485-Pleurochrysis_carterae.AAC.1
MWLRSQWLQLISSRRPSRCREGARRDGRLRGAEGAHPLLSRARLAHGRELRCQRVRWSRRGSRKDMRRWQGR